MYISLYALHIEHKGKNPLGQFNEKLVLTSFKNSGIMIWSHTYNRIGIACKGHIKIGKNVLPRVFAYALVPVQIIVSV